MVEAKALIFRLNRKIDRLNTEHKTAMRIVNMCNALTEAQKFLLKDRVQKAEIDKRNRHELRPLEVKEIFMPVTTSGEVSLIKYPDDFYWDLGIRIVVTKRGCGKKEIDLTKMDTDDKAKSLRSPFWKTSYAWEQVFGDEGKDGVYVYNGDDCKVDGMIIDYYKKPPDIHCPTMVILPDEYIDWNGIKHTEDSGWVLDALVDEGINLAAMMLTGDMGDSSAFQLKVANNTQTEQISKL